MDLLDSLAPSAASCSLVAEHPPLQPSSSSLCCSPRPPILPLVLPTHLHPVPRALASLPEAPNAPAHQQLVARRAVLRPIVTLPRAPAADHAVRPLVRVLLALVVALVARVHLLAAAEPEPPVALGVVPASTAPRELGAWRQAQRLLFPSRAAGRRQPVERRDAQELGLRDGEAELLVALAAHVPRRLAAHGDHAR